MRRVSPIIALLTIVSVIALGCVSTTAEGERESGGAGSYVSGGRSGKEIFAGQCAACHGAEGQGQPDWHVKKEDGTLPAPPLNGAGHTWHHADGLLYRIVNEGGKTLESPEVPGFKSAMPAFGGQLTHDEILAVLSYLKSLWAEKTSRGLSISESQAIVSERDPFPTGVPRR